MNMCNTERKIKLVALTQDAVHMPLFSISKWKVFKLRVKTYVDQYLGLSLIRKKHKPRRLKLIPPKSSFHDRFWGYERVF